MIPNQITTSRFDSWLRRALRIRDRSVVPALATELLAVTGFELDRVESRWLGETASYHAGVAQTSAAGVHPAVRLHNPVGSTVLAVATGLHLATDVATTVTVRLAQPPAVWTPSLVTIQKHDSRVPAITATRIDQRDLAAPPLDTPLFRVNTSLLLDWKWVLFPGSSLEAVGGQPGVSTLWAHFSWYERPFEPSEETGG